MTMKPANCEPCTLTCPERNRFYYGKALTARDFAAEQRYHNAKDWLRNRLMWGCGVVCGLDVNVIRTGEHACYHLHVKPGVAIDCCGRELIVCNPLCVEVPHFQGDACDPKDQNAREKYVICLSWDETPTEPVNMPPVCCEGEDRQEYNRIVESAKVTFHRSPHPCCPGHDHLCPLDAMRQARTAITVHDFLCSALKDRCPDGEEECCVQIGTITIYRDPEQMPKLDPCEGRRLVWSGRVLRDLIECYHGDLPRVQWISWEQHHNNPGNAISVHNLAHAVKDGLLVTFTEPMIGHTINACSFVVTAVFKNRQTRALDRHCAPPSSDLIEYDPSQNQAKFVAAQDWIDDTFGSGSLLSDYGGWLEITLRGALIRGESGKALDGDALGFPSGNGTQGGDFVSCLRVTK